jgi:hypothetical protein
MPLYYNDAAKILPGPAIFLYTTERSRLSMPMRLAMHLMVLTMFAPLALGAMPPAGTHVSLPAASTNTSQQAQAVARPYKVGLQIGHYKNNELPDVLARLEGSTGAVAAGRTELELNILVTNRLAAQLRAEGVEVDVLPATVPSGYNADAFIAIHADGNNSTRARGFKISTRWSSEVAVQDGKLVDILTERYAALTGLPEDGSVTRNMRGYYAYSPWRVNWRTSNFTPGAIVEMGFITNPTDRAFMFGQPDRVAGAIKAGIMDFLTWAYGSPATQRSYGYGKGIVDNDLQPDDTPTPRGRARTGTRGPGGVTTGNWDVVLMGKSSIPIYAESGATGGVITRLSKGLVLKSTVRKGDYYEVTTPDGKKGWIHRNAIVVQQ